jgi:2-hydroxy-4-(methylsulfanyl)butanoate S-methyltransferase
MENAILKPETINKLRFAVDAGFAMLAGMQLDLFTPLKSGPMTAEQLAAAIGVNPARLRLLLYVLVAAGLLTEQDGVFSNTSETNQFLVKDEPSYIGNRHAAIAMRWRRTTPSVAIKCNENAVAARDRDSVFRSGS